MSDALTVTLVAAITYTVLYAVLIQSAPRKAGISFVPRLRVHYATTDWSFWLEW